MEREFIGHIECFAVQSMCVCTLQIISTWWLGRMHLPSPPFPSSLQIQTAHHPHSRTAFLHPILPIHRLQPPGPLSNTEEYTPSSPPSPPSIPSAPHSPPYESRPHRFRAKQLYPDTPPAQAPRGEWRTITVQRCRVRASTPSSQG